jgi:glycosyltransferase involved in cell wall biosynthesis
MPELPLVSVVVPCLNRVHLIRPTLESILQQDYPRIECIVADGGSTDGTVDILEEYGDRIQWFSERDEGHADAINKGWRRSRGEILAWLNADDMWVAPGAVSEAVRYLREHPEVDLVYGECEAVDMDGRLIARSYHHDWDLEHAVLHCDYCIPQPASFIRRGVLERVGWLDKAFISKKDHELWLRVGLAGTIRHIPVLLARERIGPGYLAQRGDITARACVALTRKFFTLDGVPEGLRAQRRRAMSNSYLEGMKWAFECGRHWRVVFAYFLRAVSIDPSNWSAATARLSWYVRHRRPSAA